MSYTPMELADAFIKTGELADALEALNQQLEQTPNDEVAKRLRASVLLRIGNEDQLIYAIHDLKGLQNPQAEDFIQLSVLYERAGELEQATQAMKSALDLSASDVRAIERLLTLYIAQDAYDNALALVHQQSTDWRWMQWEADLLVKMDQHEDAIQQYLSVIQLLDNQFNLEADAHLRAIKGQNLLACAHAYRRLEHYVAAQQHYSAAQIILTDDPTIGFYIGVTSALQGNLDTAVNQCRMALDSCNDLLRDHLLNEISTHPKLLDLLNQLHQ